MSDLPSDLPFRLVSKTIGSGAYASIKKAVPLNRSSPVIAIKFINKEHAFKTGRLKPQQIKLEISIHSHVSGNPNIIRFLKYGEDPAWYWMALELAEGGDLFDKIEPDEGVGEDIAHFYFRQLLNAVSWCHGLGFAHRDIKPENMLLTGQGDLKLADFGLAVHFMDPRNGQQNLSSAVCGSPPYMAPEIVQVGQANLKRKRGEKAGYKPDLTDLWSCAIVLFTMLVGNTPWDSPTEESEEWVDFVQSHGRPDDELWRKISPDVGSLLRGMLKDPAERFGLTEIRSHPWYSRPNRFMDESGRTIDSVTLATNMMERLHVDLTAKPTDLQYPSTQPVMDGAEPDWEAPPRAVSASQPHDLGLALSQDPSMSQFTSSHQIPLSLTQAARKFNDIAPSHSLARFYSAMGLEHLLGLLQSALHSLRIPCQRRTADTTYIRIKTLDKRKQDLTGDVIVERVGNVHEVRFVKAKGDPLEWRRLFKQITVLCRDAVVLPAS